MEGKNGMVDGLHLVDSFSKEDQYGISKGGLWGVWDGDLSAVLSSRWSSGGGNGRGGTLLVPKEML